ncbi:MAG: transposase [Treponema sp.]|nr:transposase [Treponema sp.]
MYVDEWGVKEGVRREYGRTVTGVKVEDSKRGQTFQRVNVAAASIHGGSGEKRLAPECYQRSMTGEKFQGRIKNKSLKRSIVGKTIIMDNAMFHRKKRPMEICRKENVNLLFPPPYSPDFNPIEKDWANMKYFLKDSAPLCNETAIYNYWRWDF